MKVAFDFDGVITRYPQIMSAMAQSLIASNHVVYVLTACAGELPPNERQAEAVRRVAAIGFPYQVVYWVDSRQKGVMATHLGVDVVIDDSTWCFEGFSGLKLLVCP